MSGPRRGPRARDSYQGEPGKKRDKREVRGEFSAALREPALKEKAGAAWGCREPLNHGTETRGAAPGHSLLPGAGARARAGPGGPRP